MIANGDRMKVQGIDTLEVTVNGVRAEISPDIKERMLVSCQDLIIVLSHSLSPGLHLPCCVIC